MKSYVLFFVLLVSVLYLGHVDADEATAEKEIKEVEECLQGPNVDADLKCINKISPPLYQDIEKETEEFVKVIEEHVERWAEKEAAKKAPGS